MNRARGAPDSGHSFLELHTLLLQLIVILLDISLSDHFFEVNIVNISGVKL
jgi:hypothetical protein